ncbi:MAG: hypothetical protein KDD45_08760 [Bdellovibrionales bacterium]|nr:hypothetical protein [Bdellovibrionales bacterium]
MSKWDQDKFASIFAKNMGYSEDVFNPHLRNPANKDILATLDHNDLNGAEAKIFSTCYQEVRELVGPFKIFGSQEVSLVSGCVRAHADAWFNTLRASGMDI